MKHAGREALNILLIVLGVLSAAMGLHGFLLSSNFIDGGVTGVSMLGSKVTGTPLAVWIPVANLPFVALGYRQIGAAFALRSIAAIGGLALALATIHFPDVTPDLLLTAVFGGFFIGAGIGLAIGLAGALGLTRLLTTLLFGVSATDPATMSATAALLVAVAMAACFVPARRATAVDPLAALREE